MTELPRFFDLSDEALRDLLNEWDMPRFRAQQVLEWVYRRRVADPLAMTNLSKADRALLAERMTFTTGRVVRHQLATDGTQKLLVEWAPESLRPVRPGAVPLVANDAARQSECVMIPAYDEWDAATGQGEGGRRTACISSQVGCPVGCRFCASGLGGLDANLSAGQIVEQVWLLGTQLSPPGPIAEQRISNVVFMGMGEPMANFEAVVAAVRTLNAPWGMGISARRMTISTVGLPAQIRRLADLGLPVTLAVSLHAPNDDIRRQVIPWAQYVSIQQIIEAGREYFDKTGREVTLEYILLHDLNDRPEHARELASVARRIRSNVNLIRYNEVAGLPFERPRDEDVRRFQEILRDAGVNAHIRASRGRDIAAACGQLRHEHAAR